LAIPELLADIFEYDGDFFVGILAKLWSEHMIVYGESIHTCPRIMSPLYYALRYRRDEMIYSTLQWQFSFLCEPRFEFRFKTNSRKVINPRWSVCKFCDY
jgi:hypothetical protein